MDIIILTLLATSILGVEHLLNDKLRLTERIFGQSPDSDLS